MSPKRDLSCQASIKSGARPCHLSAKFPRPHQPDGVLARCMAHSHIKPDWSQQELKANRLTQNPPTAQDTPNARSRKFLRNDAEQNDEGYSVDKNDDPKDVLERHSGRKDADLEAENEEEENDEEDDLEAHTPSPPTNTPHQARSRSRAPEVSSAHASHRKVKGKLAALSKALDKEQADDGVANMGTMSDLVAASAEGLENITQLLNLLADRLLEVSLEEKQGNHGTEARNARRG
ncbi:hypothetical protein FB567DRAFT_584560 [Paraphoma chrysanthemicola]|uniref:Uncharacterized protein n=1 Tax=Paraphoma chrysanthemicola TaxID=798071 RepID=A0A8K0VSI2_9PLEO|nr:hypothetical protein FB567DRAFT_584560 [Paraphoma chrysanthemicola]